MFMNALLPDRSGGVRRPFSPKSAIPPPATHRAVVGIPPPLGAATLDYGMDRFPFPGRSLGHLAYQPLGGLAISLQVGDHHRDWTRWRRGDMLL